MKLNEITHGERVMFFKQITRIVEDVFVKYPTDTLVSHRSTEVTLSGKESLDFEHVRKHAAPDNDNYVRMTYMRLKRFEIGSLHSDPEIQKALKSRMKPSFSILEQEAHLLDKLFAELQKIGCKWVSVILPYKMYPIAEFSSSLLFETLKKFNKKDQSGELFFELMFSWGELNEA